MAGLHCHVLWRGEGDGHASPHPSMVRDRAACPNANFCSSCIIALMGLEISAMIESVAMLDSRMYIQY